MATSPPIEIKGADPEKNAMPQLIYAASLFKGTLGANSRAALQIMSSSDYYIDQIARALEKLQVPRHKIVPIKIANPLPSAPSIGFQSFPSIPNIEYSALLTIDYGPGKQSIKVEFKPDDKPLPFDVEFEAEPDGSMLKEVTAEWATPLKIVIADSAKMGARQVKFATKIKAAAGFDRKTVDVIETELKAKLHQSLSLYLKTKGHEHLKIQFYGALGVKYADDKSKPFGEGGVLFEIPFDLADVLK